MGSFSKGNQTLECVFAPISVVLYLGFKVNLDFIIGYPDETVEEGEETLSFIHLLKNKFQVKVQIHFFFPLSGSSYQFRFPTFLSVKEKNRIMKLTRDGVITKDWIHNEQQAQTFFTWLKSQHGPVKT